MGMSTYVIGIKPPDATWRAMKAVYDACTAADVEIPEVVERFFNFERPDPKGVIVDLEDTPAVSRWREEIEGDASGFEIDVKALPPDVTVVRFYNSW